jgi:hypothetical protein
MKHHRSVVIGAALLAQLGIAIGSNMAVIAAAGAASSVGVNGDIQLAAATYTVAQSGGSVSLVAERLGGTSGALSVTFSTSGGTAVAGKDFTAAAGTVTWANGDHANKSINVPLLNLPAYAGEKWFTVKLTAGAQTILGSGVASRVYIVGSSSSKYPGTVSLNSANYSTSESAGSITLVATRSGGTEGAASVTYTTINKTAVSGQQFSAVYGTLAWANGDGMDKTIKIPVSATPFSGTKSFDVQLTAGSGTQLGSHGSATVNIVGTATATVVTKSIKQWVTCSETVDETGQLEQALIMAANHAFTLIIDCPVRLHTGTASFTSINVPDGVTVQFQGSGEFLGVHSGPPALAVAHPATVSFIDWTYTYL